MTSGATPTDRTDHVLHLRSLGAAGLYTAQGNVQLLGPGKPFALLLLLACAPAHRASRETLIDMLWSDIDPDRTRNALRQTIFQLRRLLGEGSITGADELTLECPIRCDRDEFLAALEQDDLDGAVSLYRGAFLPSFAIPGGAAFEQWAAVERYRLEAGFLRGAELLVRRQLNRSHLKEARLLARHVRDLHPHVESAGRLVLETSLAGNDFVTAAMEANVLEQWAITEDIVLEPQTRTAISRARRVSNSEPTGDSPASLIAELTGREQDFFAITSAWDGIRKGPSRRIHISAAAGFGKTRLLRDAMARLAAAGATVIQQRGAPGDREVTYAFISDLAAQIAELPGAAGVSPASAATLVALNPTLSTHFACAPEIAVGEESLRRRILALAELVHVASTEQRFALAIDDLHWIDASSMRVLEGLWSRLDHARVLIVTAARPERVPLADGCQMISLSALDESQLRALVSTLGSLPLDETWNAQFVSGLHAATHGSPLLVLETLRVALDGGMLALDDGTWQCLDANRLTALLQAGGAIRARVRALSPAHLDALAFLAIAGTPFETDDIAQAMGSTVIDASGAISVLEQHGLVVRTSTGWTAAHDVIAEAAQSAVDASVHVRMEKRVGEFFARRAGSESTTRLRAVRHLQLAGDYAGIGRIFRDHAQRSRLLGDRRSMRAIAAELIGSEEHSEQVNDLLTAIPRLWKLGLWSRTRQFVTVAMGVLVPLGFFVVLRERVAREAALPHLYFADSSNVVTSVAVRRDAFDGGNTALVESAAQSPMLAAATGYPDLSPAVSPDARSFAWTQNMGDSTVLDIWMRTPSGTRRLVNQHRDDVVTEWLLDGSALLGETSRWSPRSNGNYNVAVFDTATGEARQITRGPAHDTQAHASPDGTRIAFIRESDALPNQLCVVARDGVEEPECRLVGGMLTYYLLGWTTLTEMSVFVRRATGGDQIVAYDWQRDAMRIIFNSRPQSSRLSPDRRWIVAALRVSGLEGYRDWIAPVDNPAQARPISRGTRRVTATRWWEGTADQSLVIDRLEFVDSTRVIALGVNTQLRVRALTVAGVEIPLFAAITWRSSDSAVASIDSLGVVMPHRSGDVTVTASLAGWRTVTKHMHVNGASARTVFEETWSDSWTQRWIPWGDPQPIVVTGPNNVRAFFNNGDDTYLSFAVLRQGFSARAGLGADIRISTLVNATRYQRLAAQFIGDIDTTELKMADQRKDAPAAVYRSPAKSCGIAFPLDGHWAETHMSVTGSVPEDVELHEAARPLRTGAWWTLRLQIFPDGRCGIAVNHRVIWISPEPIQLTGEFRLRLGNTSVGTRLLHGPLQIWTGVRTDIDWTRVTPN